MLLLEDAATVRLETEALVALEVLGLCQESNLDWLLLTRVHSNGNEL